MYRNLKRLYSFVVVFYKRVYKAFINAHYQLNNNVLYQNFIINHKVSYSFTLTFHTVPKCGSFIAPFLGREYNRLSPSRSLPAVRK